MYAYGMEFEIKNVLWKVKWQKKKKKKKKKNNFGTYFNMK